MPMIVALVKNGACKNAAIIIATNIYMMCKNMRYALCICSPKNTEINIDALHFQHISIHHNLYERFQS